MIPMPTQITDAHFLADRQRAFCWSACRTGKTGTAIMAADMIEAKTILVVTTASGRGVWRKAFHDWSDTPRRVRVIGSDPAGKTDVAIVSWEMAKKLVGQFAKRPGVTILDEDHKATNPEAQRTQHVYGRMVDDGETMLTDHAIVQPGDRVWHLSATPLPHDLGNAWARMRASCPERLLADPRRGWPDVTAFGAFREHYCRIGYKKLPNMERIPIMLEGKNAPELRARLDGMYVRRTQAEVGIKAPAYELLPLIVSAAARRELADVPHANKILAAADAGDTDALEKWLKPIRRLTGIVKAKAVVQAVTEEFEGGLPKIVLAYWHRDVGDILEEGLSKFGVVRLDGSTSMKGREAAARDFGTPGVRVFLAQIEAACEAIDLSAANELWIVEFATSPRQMDQISKRITNVNQRGSTFVRACCIEGSIDEKLQASLMRLWRSIKEVVT